MTKYLLSKSAQKDLSGIWDYTVKNWSKEQANRYLRKILKSLNDISLAPEYYGKGCDDIRKGYRKYRCGNHLVFYTRKNGDVFVVRILHEKMDFKRHF